MRTASTTLAAAGLGILLGVPPGHTQTTIQDYCKLPNATVVVVELQNGKKLELALRRDGNKMSGTVGSDAGSATVAGEFSGQDVYWELAFQDASKIMLMGQLGNGEGNGVAGEGKIKWTARTAVGCARWPDGKALAAVQQPAAPAQPQATAPAQTQTTAPKPQPQPQQQQQRVQQPARVQAAKPAAVAARKCPEGTTQAADGTCVRQVSPLALPFQLLIPGLAGGFNVQIGR
jgi:hypothetical protein